MEYKDTNKVRFTLRVPERVHDKVNKAAIDNGYSKNKMIEMILDESIKKVR